MSRYFSFALSDAELSAIDERIRQTIFNDREAGVPWNVTAPKVAKEVASVRISHREMKHRQHLRSVGNSHMHEDISSELEEMICERILAPAGRPSDFDPDQVLNGASAIGWAAMFMRSAAVFASIRHSQVAQRTVPAEIGDEDQGLGMTPIRVASAEDDRASEAEQMIALMGRGLSEQERKSVVVLGIGWFLKLPYAWPQVSAVRNWVADHVDGPRSAVQTIEEARAARAVGDAHPLDAMFSGWTDDHFSDLTQAHPMVVFAWVTGAASARPGPARRLEQNLGNTMLELSTGTGWRSAVRQFASALSDAMSGADRHFQSKKLTVLPDEALVAANDRLWDTASRVASFEGAPLGSDPETIVAEAISALVASEYNLAMASESKRLRTA